MRHFVPQVSHTYVMAVSVACVIDWLYFSDTCSYILSHLLSYMFISNVVVTPV